MIDDSQGDGAQQRMYVPMVAHQNGGDRFFEVVVRGARLFTRAGASGTDGWPDIDRMCDSPEQARAQAETLVEDKRREGYRPVEHVVGEHARNRSIEAMILDDPDEVGNYLVYSDWLQSQGDPRGELIMLDYRYSQPGKRHDARLFRHRKQFERQHKARFLPEILRSMIRLHIDRDGQSTSNRCTADVAYSFVRRASIGRRYGDSGPTVRELTLALLHHPSGALLQELSIGALATPRQNDYRAYRYQSVVDAICQAGPLGLRTLTLADVADHDVGLDDVHLGDLSQLWPSLPRLANLHLRGGQMQLGAIRSPSLRRLLLSTPIVTSAMLQSINDAEWPELTELALPGGGERFDIDSLPDLLAGERVPALRSLALTDTRETGTLVQRLLGSPLLGQLTALDLSGGDFSDNDAHLIIDNQDAFRSLKKLVLDRNVVTRRQRAEIWSVLPQGIMDDQRGGAQARPHYTSDDIVAFAYDGRSVGRARELVDMNKWPSIGIWGPITWGRCQGRRMYETYAEIRRSDDIEGGCTCPSRQHPCKHVIGLLMLTMDNPRVPTAEPPTGLLEACRGNRYDSAWE